MGPPKFEEWEPQFWRVIKNSMPPKWPKSWVQHGQSCALSKSEKYNALGDARESRGIGGRWWNEFCCGIKQYTVDGAIHATAQRVGVLGEKEFGGRFRVFRVFGVFRVLGIVCVFGVEQ